MDFFKLVVFVFLVVVCFGSLFSAFYVGINLAGLTLLGIALLSFFFMLMLGDE